MGGHSFCIDHGFIRRHVERQVLLMTAPKDPQGGPECRPCSLAGMAMDLAAAIAIPCPLMRGQVPLQPHQGEAIVQELGNGKVDHAVI